MSMTVTSFADEHHGEWAVFVDQCPEAWLHHRPECILGHARECSFSLRENGRMVAVCVLDRVAEHRGAVLAGPGLAIGEGAGRATILAAASDELRRRAGTFRCQAVRFDLPMVAPAFARGGYAESSLAALGFSNGWRPRNMLYYAPSIHSVVDLTQSEADILTGFNRGNRTHVNRALKKKLELHSFCGSAPPDPLWDDFVHIHKGTFARSGLAGFGPQQLDHLRDLVAKGYVALLAVYDGAACASSHLFEVYKGGVNYLAGGCPDWARQSGMMAFAMFNAMRWAKAHGCTAFNIGPSFPTLADTPYGAVGQSKLRFGGQRRQGLAGEWIVAPQAYFLRIFLPCFLRFLVIHVALPSAVREKWRVLRARRHGGRAPLDHPINSPTGRDAALT